MWRSPPANTTWTGYGGALGHNPASGGNQRNSNYITQSGQTGFNSNQYPLGVSKNGIPLIGAIDLGNSVTLLRSLVPNPPAKIIACFNFFIASLLKNFSV